MSSIGGVCIDCGGPFTSIHNCPARNTAGAVYAPSVLSEVERLRAEIARLEGDRERLRSALTFRGANPADEWCRGCDRYLTSHPHEESCPFAPFLDVALGVG